MSCEHLDGMDFDAEGTLMSDTAGTREPLSVEPLRTDEEAGLRADLIRAEREMGLGWWGERYLRLLATLDRDRAASLDRKELAEKVLALRKHAQRQGTWGIEYGDDNLMADVLRLIEGSDPASPEPEWTAQQHRKDVPTMQRVMQEQAEKRLPKATIYVSRDDASDMLMALHKAGLYLPTPVAGSTIPDRPLDVDYEQMRKDRGWPTPNHMRSAADALDVFTPARYGEVLRWFADLADASLKVEAPVTGEDRTA